MSDPVLKLAFIGNPASPHVRKWAEYFARRGHEVSVLEGFGFGPNASLDPSIRLIRYDAHGRIRLPFVPALHSRLVLRRLLGELRPDVVHAHTVKPYGWQAGVAAVHPYVISTWGSDVLLPPSGWRPRFWHHRTLSRADLVTAVSPFMRDAAIRLGARPERVALVHFGVDTEHHVPAPVDPARLRAMGLDERPFIFSPRAVKPLYNHETILDAFAQLGPGYQLVMTGRNADPAYLTEVRERIGALALTEQVQFMDEIADDDMLALYQGAAAVVSVPHSDSFPISLLEAMACGTPIVAGDLPPIRAELDDLVPELVVPTRDASALVETLKHVLALSVAERRDLGSRLRQRVIETADYQTNMRRMEGLYRDLAAKR